VLFRRYGTNSLEDGHRRRWVGAALGQGVELLVVLAEDPERVFKKDELLRDVWGPLVR
jgi:DNA-binding winged helix-turn-helix (wHTH) protein